MFESGKKILFTAVLAALLWPFAMWLMYGARSIALLQADQRLLSIMLGMVFIDALCAAWAVVPFKSLLEDFLMPPRKTKTNVVLAQLAQWVSGFAARIIAATFAGALYSYEWYQILRNLDSGPALSWNELLHYGAPVFLSMWVAAALIAALFEMSTRSDRPTK